MVKIFRLALIIDSDFPTFQPLFGVVFSRHCAGKRGEGLAMGADLFIVKIVILTISRRLCMFIDIHLIN